MADLSAAIAAFRAAHSDGSAEDVYRTGKALLAALDAAQGEAVAFGRLVSGLIVDCIPASEAHAPAEESGYAVPLYLAPQAPPAAVPAERYTVDAVAWEEFIADWQQYIAGDPKMPFFRVREGLVAIIDSATQAPPAAGASANVTPMRQPRADLARLVESINAAVYANGDGLSVTEAIGALELAKLELLKEQER